MRNITTNSRIYFLLEKKAPLARNSDLQQGVMLKVSVKVTRRSSVGVLGDGTEGGVN